MNLDAFGLHRTSLICSSLLSEGAGTSRQQASSRAASANTASLGFDPPANNERSSASPSASSRPRSSLCTRPPLPDTLDSARLLGEQVSRPSSGSTCLTPAQHTQTMHHQTPDRHMKLGSPASRFDLHMNMALCQVLDATIIIPTANRWKSLKQLSRNSDTWSSLFSRRPISMRTHRWILPIWISLPPCVLLFLRI